MDILAIGENGLEPTPIEDVVFVPTAPVGEANVIVPATLRFLHQYDRTGVPIRLIHIRRANTRLNRKPFPIVTFGCTRFVRYTLKGRAIWGDVNSCAIRDENDALDPFFERLSVAERARILRAVRRCAQ